MNIRLGPWRRSLLATCALSAAVVAASLLWQSGSPQWAFVLVFATVWVTLSLAWSDVDYSDQSGVVLARIVDHNFDRVHERLEELERQLDVLRTEHVVRSRQAS